MAFSGIATPETFERQLTNLGAEIVKRHRFTDHYAYEPEDIEQVLKTSKDATMIVTTQKDAVRLPRMESEVPVCYLRMEIEILDGVANFNEAVQKICFPKDGDGGHTRPMV